MGWERYLGTGLMKLMQSGCGGKSRSTRNTGAEGTTENTPNINKRRQKLRDRVNPCTFFVSSSTFVIHGGTDL